MPLSDLPLRVLVLADDRYGANWNIESAAPSIVGALSSFGWKVETASASGTVAPCAWAASRGLKPFATDRRVSEIGDVAAYDALVVLPGQGHEKLLSSVAALELVRRADRAGLAIAAFCRGVRVLARAGILRDRRMTGHADYEDEYRAAGAIYIGYEDKKGKSDAPPPVVDDNLVTSMRSDYFRGWTCDAIRLAAERSRFSRALRAAEPMATARAEHAPEPGRKPRHEPQIERRGETLVFAFPIERGEEEFGLALARSIRDFAGSLSRSRILVLSRAAVDSEALAGLAALGAETLAYDIPAGLPELPFSWLPAAAARAEAEVEGRAGLLAWMAPDSLVLREPSEFLLPPEAALGFRPVHHALIGSRAGSPPDDYWSAIYQACGADPASAFAVVSTVDRSVLRFYPNAGHLAVRPRAGILRAWAENFGCLSSAPSVAATYPRDGRRPVFSHQAFLAATILSRLPRSALRELSFAYNYPLHLHSACPAHLAPRALEDLTVARYDGRAAFPGRAGASGPELPPIGPALSEWLRDVPRITSP